MLWKLTVGGKWSPVLSAHRMLAPMPHPLQRRTVVAQQPYDGFVHVPILQKGTEEKAHCWGKGREERSSKIRARACPPKGLGGIHRAPRKAPWRPLRTPYRSGREVKPGAPGL